MRIFTVLVVVALTACSSQELAQTSGDVEVTGSKVDLGSAFVGYPVHRALGVENTSSANLTLQLSAAGPFSVPSSLVLGGGQLLNVDVTFAPTSPGAATATITLVGDRVHLEVTVAGEGQAAPVCAAGGACEAIAFDPDAGACVTTTEADGTDCSSSALCLDHPVCQAGVCSGTQLSCDDHDVCTVDACGPSIGCTHVAIVCPAPSDPCQVAACDPSSGCNTQSAPDGTICGSVDCGTAHICLLGACQAVTPPEGTECAPASACRGEGTCQGGQCSIPDAGVLVPAWTYSLDGGGEISFNGTLDGDGNLYWAECVSSCQLVSATRDGYVRYRAPLLGTSVGSEYGYIGGNTFGLFGTAIVLATQEGSVEAHDAASGNLLWSTAFDSIFSDGGSPGAWEVGGLAVGPAGTVIVLGTQVASDGPGPFAPESEQLVLSLADGQVVSMAAYPGSISEVIEDAEGSLWGQADFSSSDGGVLEGLASLDLDGGATSTSSLAGGFPIAAYGGWVFASEPGLSSVLVESDGGEVYQPIIVDAGSTQIYVLDNPYGFEPSVVFDGTVGFLFSNSSYSGCGFGPCDPVSAWGSIASGFEADGGGITWSLPIAPPSWFGFYGPLLTNRSTVLVAMGGLPTFEGDTPAQTEIPVDIVAPTLMEIDGAGQVLSSCQLPGAEDYAEGVGGTALSSGRWYVSRYLGGLAPTIEAYDVPGADIDPHGWVSAGGNPAHTGQPW